jgi:hypothetical protein
MNTTTLLWLFPIFFMIHEFEEIVFVKPWTTHHQKDPGVANEMFMRNASIRRISTATLALLIGEEFLIMVGLTAIAVHWQLYALFIGLLIAYSVHLIVHLGEMVYFRRYIPGTVTALLTLPPLFYIYDYVVVHALHTTIIKNIVSGEQTTLWAIGLGVLLILNLSWLYKISTSVQRALHIGNRENA